MANRANVLLLLFLSIHLVVHQAARIKKRTQSNISAGNTSGTKVAALTANQTEAKRWNDPTFDNDPSFNSPPSPHFGGGGFSPSPSHFGGGGFSPSPGFSDDDFSRRHDNAVRQHTMIMAAMIGGFFFLVIGVPVICCTIGYCRARGIRTKMETMKFAYPQMQAPRVPAVSLGDGMGRLSQETRVLVRQNVNKLQELSTHLAGFSIQTANSFEVVSATPGAPEEVLLACREVQDLQALVGMNLGGVMGAVGNMLGNETMQGGGQHFAGRDKAPFRMTIGLPQTTDAKAPDNMMQVIVPQGVGPGQQIITTAPDGQQIQVSVPPGVSAGMTFPVILPKEAPQQGMMGGAANILHGLAPGSEPNTDMPFLYLDRPFAFDCCCVNRPHVSIFDMRGGVKVQLGVISDPFACIDMTFNLHIGPTATEATPPTLVIKGAACQPGAHCQLCGMCCGRRCREVYLEVVDPNRDNKTVAFITKGWAGAFKEILTQANSFYVDFGEVQDPACKALLVAVALFIDYRFFEGRAGNQRPNN